MLEDREYVSLHGFMLTYVMLVASCYSSPLLAKHRCLECWGPCSRRHPAGVPVGKNPWKTHFCYKGFVRILRYNPLWTWVSSFMTSTTSQPSNIYGSIVKSVLCIYIYSTPKDPLVASSVLKHLVVFSLLGSQGWKDYENQRHASFRPGGIFVWSRVSVPCFYSTLKGR